MAKPKQTPDAVLNMDDPSIVAWKVTMKVPAEAANTTLMVGPVYTVKPSVFAEIKDKVATAIPLK